MKHEQGVTPDTSDLQLRGHSEDSVSSVIKAATDLLPVISTLLGKPFVGTIVKAIVGLALPNTKLERALTFIEILDQRTSFLEANYRAENIQSIVSMAVQELGEKGRQTHSEEPLDRDWVHRLLGTVEDVSDPEMQAFWAKILTGEISQPGSFSLRTIELVKSLSKEEALSFQSVSPFALFADGYYFVQSELFEGQSDQKPVFGREVLTRLKDADLLRKESLGSMYAPAEGEKREMRLYHMGKVIGFEIQVKTVWNPQLTFSKSGSELLRLVTSEPNMKYFCEAAINISGGGTGLTSVWLASSTNQPTFASNEPLEIDELTKRTINPYVHSSET